MLKRNSLKYLSIFKINFFLKFCFENFLLMINIKLELTIRLAMQLKERLMMNMECPGINKINIRIITINLEDSEVIIDNFK